jgi:hypothetical protein
MGGATIWIDDDSNIDDSTTSVVVIVACRASNINLVRRGCRR